ASFKACDPCGNLGHDRHPKHGGGYTTAALIRAVVTRPLPLRQRLRNCRPTQG
ncbi:hypothetical protein KI387_013153, partial [Taxus chinensis]